MFLKVSGDMEKSFSDFPSTPNSHEFSSHQTYVSHIITAEKEEPHVGFIRFHCLGHCGEPSRNSEDGGQKGRPFLGILLTLRNRFLLGFKGQCWVNVYNGCTNHQDVKSLLAGPRFSSRCPWTPNTALTSRMTTWKRSVKLGVKLTPIMTQNSSEKHCTFWPSSYTCSTLLNAISSFRRLVDWRMLPLLGLLYSIALIDRTNLGIARAAGMEIELVG